VAARRHQHAPQLASRERARVSLARAPHPLLRGLQESAADGEHEGLREYRQNLKGRRVEILLELRSEVAHVIALKLTQLGCPVLVVSVGKKHAHALTEMPGDLSELRRIIGKCKTARSSRMRKALPGTIWGEGGKFKLVPNTARREIVYDYIAHRQERGAKVWTHAQGPLPAPKGFR
jgi:hypothetical protein